MVSRTSPTLIFFFFFSIRGWCYFSWQELSNQRHCCIMGNIVFFSGPKVKKKTDSNASIMAIFPVTKFAEGAPFQGREPPVSPPAGRYADVQITSDLGRAARTLVRFGSSSQVRSRVSSVWNPHLKKVQRGPESSPPPTLHQLDLRLLHHHLFTRSSVTSGEQVEMIAAASLCSLNLGSNTDYVCWHTMLLCFNWNRLEQHPLGVAV